MYNFKEVQLPAGFAAAKMSQIKQLINTSTSFTLLGLPGVGVSYVLRYLATTNLAHFVFVDSFALTTLSQAEYLALLLHELGGDPKHQTEQQIYEGCKEKLKLFSQKNNKIVIVFNRFDQLFTVPDQSSELFMGNLRSLETVAPEKIIMIFTSNKPLYELCPKALLGANISFYSQLLYFGIYKNKDLIDLLGITTNIEFPNIKADKSLKLAGGHNQLLQILLTSESQDPLQDHFVKLQLREIYDILNSSNKKIVQQIAQGKSPKMVDPYLFKLGIVRETAKGYELFSPLFARYINSCVPVKIPAKEGKLFKLLQKNLGQIVSKDEIFDYVWGDNPDVASDWALNALIYRLKKNPSFLASGYMIENHKKTGYSLQR